MQEERVTATQNDCIRHRPASDQTQDISSILANIFKDLYTNEVTGKDTVTSLTKARREDNSYQDKYVQELQQVHLEYSRRMRDAEMLEKHISQARRQASDKEEQAQASILEEVGEAYHQLSLPLVKPAFLWCVDNDLLKRNHLICPQDCITEQVPLIKAPKGKPSTPGFAQPTVSYNMHVGTQPQDDGYSPVPHSDLTIQSVLERSEETLTLFSSEEASSTGSIHSQKVSQMDKHSWKLKVSAQSKAEDKAALQKLRKPQNFLRNPHFQPLSGQRGGESLIATKRRVQSAPNKNKECCSSSSPEAPVPVFIASPPVVLFDDYRVGQVYEATVELRNMTAASRHVRVIPPTTPHFSVGLGRFPGDGGVVAPGISCQYTVRFAPDSLDDYEDFLLVETQSPFPLVVPLEARRPPPVLTLPAVLDFGYCLVGGVKFMEVLCRNDGLSAGTFCIMPKHQWPASSLRSAVKASFAEQPPFAVSPCLFALLPGQAVVMEVVFFPAAAESCAQSFTIVCDNCQVKDFTMQGMGQLVMLELVAMEGGEDLPELGELRDLTADHFVRFDPANLNSISQKKLIIKNNTHLELPFQWCIMKPNLQPLLPGETPDPSGIQHHLSTDNCFSISPEVGMLDPAQEHVFLLSYHPEQLMDYHSVCRLVIRDVPDMQNIYEDGGSQQLDMIPKVGDAIVMEIDVKGSTEPYKILLEPYALIIPVETYIHTTIRKSFKMWNHSKSAICFEWERISDHHIIEVEPSSGEIEMNECFDMDLILTGGQPGHFATTLQCHVKHHPNPIGLPIEATFKGPQLTLSVPSLDLGLLQLGQEVCSTILISNNSPLEAQWSLRKLPSDPTVNFRQVKINPSEGVLPPLASCSVDVCFRAVCCQSFEGVLQLSVLDGTGCFLSVRADVQSPQVCLLCCELLLTDVYVGVAQSNKVTLFNQTLLPAHFTWSNQLHGPQAHLCSASFTPTSGTLEPNTQMEISVSFTAHTDEELSEVTAVCEVEGMKKPVVLEFSAKAKRLSVSYSLPDTDCAGSDVVGQQSVILDFTEDQAVLIGKSVTRQLMVTNHTAIAAPFTMAANVFTGRCPLQSVRKREIVRMPFHEMQAKKIEEKEYEEFVSGLLAHGKGAAFFTEPESGTLGPFESAIINITAFNNMWGTYEDHLICQVGDLDPVLIPMRLSVRGCPIHFQMIGPQPDNQNQGPIIRFGTHVSEGDTVSRLLRLNNTSPYDIRMDWLTYNKESEDGKLIDLIVAYGEPFPLKDADGNEVVGGLEASMAFPPPWGQSHTPSTDRTSSSLRTRSGCSEFVDELCGEEETGTLVSVAPVKKLFSVFINPHEGNAADYPYCITPQQIVVPARGSSTIHVSFTPLTLSDPSIDQRCIGYALGFMSLDSKVDVDPQGQVFRAQGYELEPLRLDLEAFVKPAVLTVQLEEDEDMLEFSAAASDLLDGDMLRQESLVVQTLQLSNSTDMPLGFRLCVQQPFSVLKSGHRHSHTVSSHSPSLTHSQSEAVKSQPALLLQPKRTIQVKVAFHLSTALLTYQNQPVEDIPPSVTVLCSERGEKKLCFQQSLTIQYSNNTVQTVPLCAHLALPTLYFSCDSINFGTCYVGQTRIKEVHLYNRGGSSSCWTTLIEAEEGSEVFRVAPEHGLLKPLEYPVSSCRQTLEISFTANDERSYQGMLTVQGILGEPPLTLHLEGNGSFDERCISLTPGS